MSPRPFSLRIFLPGADPEGLRIIEKSNWSGSGIVVPRALLPEARKRKELDRTGVYVLVGPAEDSGLPKVYVGEGDPIRPRLDQHAGKKDFWTVAFAFSSKDENLNKAHVQYLEARLVALAASAKRCTLENGTVPQHPSLSEADAADAEGFLAEMLLCFPVLGVSVFTAPTGPSTPRRTELVLKAKGIEARGFEAAEGFVVRAGSQAVRGETKSILPYLTALRRALLANGVFREEGPQWVITQDYAFPSPSTAAGVLLGSVANGRVTWKSEAGRTLKDLQTGGVGDQPAGA